MARTNFENLRVYKLSEKLADHIWHIALGWSVFARDTVGKQLVKAADSIGANISEGSCLSSIHWRGAYLHRKKMICGEFNGSGTTSNGLRTTDHGPRTTDYRTISIAISC